MTYNVFGETLDLTQLNSTSVYTQRIRGFAIMRYTNLLLTLTLTLPFTAKSMRY